MESRTKLAGHPIHPMLIVYPAGLLSASVVFDIVYALTGNSDFATVAFWTLAGGLLGGAAAAIFGLIDWLGIPQGTRARRIGLFHGGGNAVVVVVFAISFLLRLGRTDYLPDVVPMILSIAGLLIALVTLWLGGELVYRLGVAVDPGANLDAPSSLSDEPASRRAAT
jgi:uncharacterized membrane protein